MKKHLIATILFVILVSGCSGQTTNEQLPGSAQQEIVEVADPTATELILPTDTEPPAPTHTAEMPTATPLPIPSPRYMHNLVYDQAAKKFVLFGGTSEVTCGYQPDTWIFDLDSKIWEEVTPAESPPEGQGTMAYDRESQRVVLFIGTLAGSHEDSGGDDTGRGGSKCIPVEDPKKLTPAGETWVYDLDNNQWTRMETSEGPFGLLDTRMVYNAAADRMVLFGGWFVGEGPDSGASDATWVYDLNSNTWTEMSPEVSPPGRMDHAMAYDAESDRVILWGGGGRSPIKVGDIWTYDLSANIWEERPSDDAPRSLKGAAMVYDALNDRTLLYFKKEFWAYDDNNNQWTLLSDSPAPLGLLNHALEYDTNKDLVLKFGGGPDFHQWSNHTWIYDPKTDEWTDVTQR
jgi:hypothetical protein